MEIETKTRKWGSSIGVILPKKVVDEIGIKPNEIIRIEVKKNVKVRDVFGMLPNWKRSADEIVKDLKKGWD